jgi:hypothetical protein
VPWWKQEAVAPESRATVASERFSSSGKFFLVL